MTEPKKIVLAYSGGLDTSVILHWLVSQGHQVTTFTGRRDATIRLLYWQAINDKFMQVHGQEITDAYSSLGETMPDFASLGRAEALQAIEAFIAAGGSGRAADLLGRGLRDLDPEIILTQWV